MQKALTSDVRPKCGESVKKVYGGFTMIEKILGVQPAFLNQSREKDHRKPAEKKHEKCLFENILKEAIKNGDKYEPKHLRRI